MRSGIKGGCSNGTGNGVTQRAREMIGVLLVLVLIAGCSQVASAQSGAITGYGGTAQCYVLIDSVPGTPACVHRASVACVVGNVGYVGGVASYTGPLTYPVAIPLYQRPSQTAAGMLTIPEIPTTAGSAVQVGLNGTLSTWVLSAPFTGATCSDSVPPLATPHFPRLCREYGIYCGS